MIQLASLGLQSNFQRSLDFPWPSPLGSKLQSQPSPPGKSTCSWPPNTAYAGDDQEPWYNFLFGELSVHRTFGVCLFMAKNAGSTRPRAWAWHLITLMDVTTNKMSPANVSEQVHILCWLMPKSFIMSNFQTTSASSLATTPSC